MNEAHFAEIERVLLYVSEARRRAEAAVRALRKEGADAHLLEAAEEAERELERIGRTLMQQTYFAVPSDQLTFAGTEKSATHMLATVPAPTARAARCNEPA